MSSLFASMLARRAVLGSTFAMMLAGCGDDEPAQRKAFITFLQTRIIDKPGVHLARPTPDEEKSWGDYAKHYAVITTFNDALSNRVTKPMQDVVGRSPPRTLTELADRHADLVELGRQIDILLAELDRQFAVAEAARAGLKQPPDLKTVFDAAYDRDVAGPVRAMKEVLPTTRDGLASAAALAGLLAQNRARIKFDGPNLQIADPALQREVQARLTDMNNRNQQVNAARQRLRTLISGS